VGLPVLQLVRMESSVNSSQHSGSGSITLDYSLVNFKLRLDSSINQHTITGGNIAVVALGSTGCSIVCSSSLSAEGLEFDLNLLEPVFCVSAR
jgi:hypothetical protein